MSHAIYALGGKLSSLSSSDVVSTLQKTELALRKGTIKYVDTHFLQEQISDIKASWPDDVKAVLREKSKAAASSSVDGKIPMETIRSIVQETILEVVVPRRIPPDSKNPSQAKLAEARRVAVDMALSALFRVAPATDTSRSPRRYAGKVTVDARGSTKPSRLVVDVRDVDKADVFVLAYYNPEASRAMLLGFASKTDLRSAQKGSSATDPTNCNWASEAYYIPVEKLRPMSDFLAKLSITEVPFLTLFESVPAKASIPQEPDNPLSAMLQDKPVASDDDFLRVVFGIKPATPQAADVPEPVEDF